MTMPAVVQTLGAALPLVTIVLLMLVARWSAARAGAVGRGVTLACAWGIFAYGREVYGDLGTLSAMAGAFAEALFTAGTILWIIFPALCIHQGQAGRQLSIYARANPLGLLPEQIDPGSGAFLGNYPQAFSHIGLISSAVNLARFMKKERS